MQFIKIGIYYFLGMVVLLHSCTEDTTNSIETVRPTINSLQTIIDDMALPHDALPHGAVHFDWGQAARIGWGNNPPADWTAMIPWGQVYEPTSGSAATNTRIQLRNLAAWYLSKTDDEWRQWTFSESVEGANYVEDFVDDKSKPADIRQEATGGISTTAGDGYNFHFWSENGRVRINPTDIAGTWITMEARLIVDDPNKSDDRAEAKYLLNVGGDYWKSLTAEWDQWKTNGDIAIARFKWLTSEWQAFNMHTLTEQQLLNNPPPIQ